MSMFCFQCQETAKGTGCTIAGVCGKSDKLANMMDLLIYTVKGISVYSTSAREMGIENEAVDKFVVDGLFITITNVNFDPERITLQQALKIFGHTEEDRGVSGVHTGQYYLTL